MAQYVVHLKKDVRQHSAVRYVHTVTADTFELGPSGAIAFWDVPTGREPTLVAAYGVHSWISVANVAAEIGT